jgi:hypothetical protein
MPTSIRRCSIMGTILVMSVWNARTPEALAGKNGAGHLSGVQNSVGRRR